MLHNVKASSLCFKVHAWDPSDTIKSFFACIYLMLSCWITDVLESPKVINSSPKVINSSDNKHVKSQTQPNSYLLASDQCFHIRWSDRGCVDKR